MLNRCGTYGDAGLWFRKVYGQLVKKQIMTATIRPGDRTKPGSHGYIPLGVPIPVRIIKRPGTGYQRPREDKVVISPELEPDDGTTVVIRECFAKPFGEVTTEDLHGCAPDSATSELAAYNLGIIYDHLPLGLDEVVTIWRWKYLPNVSE